MKSIFASLMTLAMSLALPAQATTIDLMPDQSQLNIGDTITVDVRITGLEDSNAPSLGVYDVTFNYDDSLFSVNQIIWGDTIHGNQLDLTGFGTLQDVTQGSGWISLFELSFDNPLDLEALQTGEFTLFSVLLDAVDAGTGYFSLDTNTLGDAYGNAVFINSINNASVTVGSTSVPEPSGLLLLIGMLGAFMIRKTSAM